MQRRLDEALAERDEGEAQRAAMPEILQVINSSPGDPRAGVRCDPGERTQTLRRDIRQSDKVI